MTEIVTLWIRLSTEISQGDVLTYPFFLPVNMWSFFFSHFSLILPGAAVRGVQLTGEGSQPPSSSKAVQTLLSISDDLSCEILFHMV